MRFPGGPVADQQHTHRVSFAIKVDLLSPLLFDSVLFDSESLMPLTKVVGHDDGHPALIFAGVGKRKPVSAVLCLDLPLFLIAKSTAGHLFPSDIDMVEVWFAAIIIDQIKAEDRLQGNELVTIQLEFAILVIG